MSYSSGEAAEQVVRMTLNGVEVAAKISGKAAERLAVLLYAVLKDQKKTRGKTRLNSMLRSGKELKVFAIGDRDLEKFCREAKKYGILYCVLKDKTANDGHTDVFVRAEDAKARSTAFSSASALPPQTSARRVPKSSRQRRNRRTQTFLFPTEAPRKRTRRKPSWMRFLPLRPIRRRRKRKTPRKARLRNPVRPSLHQISARKPSGVSLILRNAPAHLSGRK